MRFSPFPLRPTALTDRAKPIGQPSMGRARPCQVRGFRETRRTIGGRYFDGTATAALHVGDGLRVHKHRVTACHPVSLPATYVLAGATVLRRHSVSAIGCRDRRWQRVPAQQLHSTTALSGSVVRWFPRTGVTRNGPSPLWIRLVGLSKVARRGRADVEGTVLQGADSFGYTGACPSRPGAHQRWTSIARGSRVG